MMNFNLNGSTKKMTVFGSIQSSLTFFMGLSVLANPNFSLLNKQCEQVEEIADQDPTTQTAESDQRIQTIATNIVNWKKRYSNGLWWSCGKSLNVDEQLDLALEISSAVIVASDEYSTEDFWLDPEEIILTMAIESSFDPCAVGKSTREFAYQKKLWVRSKKTISHSREDLAKLVAYRDVNGIKSNIDMGLTQILWPRYYNGSYSEMTDIFTHTDIAAQMMVSWAKMKKMDRPALLWKGWSDKNIEHRNDTLRKFRFQFYGS